MKFEIKTPPLPESVSDATVAAWHKHPGDTVARGEVIGDLETDKVALELPSPESGVLTEISEKVGAVVVAGQLLAVVDAGKEASSKPVATASESGKKLESASRETASPGPADAEQGRQPASHQPASAGPASAEQGRQPASVGSAGAEQGRQPINREPASAGPASAEQSHRPAPVAPAAKRLIAEKSLKVEDIIGTGRRGTILKEDVMRHLQEIENIARSAQSARAIPTDTSAEPDAGSAPPVIAKPAGKLDIRGDKRVPMTRIRARTAERLVQSRNETASLTTFNEVNMAPVKALRKRFGEDFLKQHDVKLGFMSIFTHACIDALRIFPLINASIDGNDIIYHNYFDIGIAISSPRGLVVPIIRNADQQSLAQIEKIILDYSERAKNNKMTMEDLTGGTFSITNGGIFGSMLSTPIINPPQTAILGMHAIRERAVVEEGEVVIRPMMYLALTYDHRLIDGRDAVRFLARVKDSIEEPARLLLNL